MPDKHPADDQTEADDPVFLDRVMRYLDDALSPEGHLLLKEELARDRRKRETFFLICISDTLTHEELPAMLAANSGEAALEDDADEQPAAGSGGLSETMIMPAIGAVPDEPDLAAAAPASYPESESRKQNPRWWRTGRWAALLLLAITLIFLLSKPWKAPTIATNMPKAESRSSPASAIAPPIEAPVVATLTAVAGAQWGDQSNFAPGEKLVMGQTLELTSGCVGLQFPNDSRLILEAPSQLRLTSAGAIELIRGKVSVKMQHGKSGFIVATPDSKVTDLGTEFGVSVDPLARTTDVHVFLGRVQVAMPAATTQPQEVAAGEMAHVSGGAVTVTPGGSLPQLFVRDISRANLSLSVADLISGGDGTSHRVNGVIDPMTGTWSATGTLSPWYPMTQNAQERPLSDGRYHLVAGLPVVNGCFVPDTTGKAAQVDAAAHSYSFPVTSGVSSMRIGAGGTIPPAPNGDRAATKMGGIDFAAGDHSLVLMHSNVGITFDLAEIRHLHPNARLVRFHCTLGNSDPSSTPARGKADFFALVDGKERFTKKQFSHTDGTFAVDLLLADSDRFLTLSATDGGDTVWCDMVVLGDAAFDLTADGN